MVHVIVSVRVKTGRLQEFVEIFKSNMPNVQAEKGCIHYFPAVDIPADLPPQVFDENVVTIIEKWESLEALHNHLATSHMATYHKKTADIVESVSLKVLQEA